MSKFEVGDRVRYIGEGGKSYSRRIGDEGVVVSDSPNSGTTKVRYGDVVINNSTCMLELIEPGKTDEELAKEYRSMAREKRSHLRELIRRGYTVQQSGHRPITIEDIDRWDANPTEIYKYVTEEVVELKEVRKDL